VWTLQRKEKSYSSRESNPDRQTVARRYVDWAILALLNRHDNAKTSLEKKIGCEDVNWIELLQRKDMYWRKQKKKLM
jgi:hypothetical protein